MKTIKVLQWHIKNGLANHLCCCPIALALKRAFKTGNVFVTGEIAEIEGKKYALPRVVENFIERFDRAPNQQLKFKPFEFKLGEALPE